ncbi:MAG: exosortase/archaeosortase family protein [Candidatus Rokuibacteriota bacterium]
MLTLAQDLDPRVRANAVKILAIGVLLVVTYLPALGWLHEKYSEPDSYYSHGYLIPLVSAYVVWHKRRRLAGLTVTPSSGGLWLLAGGLGLYVLSRWWYVNFPAALSIPIVLTGLSLYLWGRAATRELWLPLAYLLFAIPLPKIAIIYVTFWLKLLAASGATEVVAGLGVPILLQGAFIELPRAVIEVDNACSGLRSLIALTALGTIWAYVLPVSSWKKWAVVALSVPLAWIANLNRIVAVILVKYWWDPSGRAFEMVDFTTGLSVFAMAALGLYLVSRGVIAWERRAPAPAKVA